MALKRCHLTAIHEWRAVQGTPWLPVGRAVVASAEEAESSAQHICVLSVGGNTLLESARPGVWVGTPIPTG